MGAVPWKRWPAAVLCGLIGFGGAAEEKRIDLFGDPLPAGALARMGTSRLRCCGGSAVFFSADGKSVAADGAAVRLWEVPGGRELPVPGGRPAGSLVRTLDGKLMAVGLDGNGTEGSAAVFRVREVETGKAVFERKVIPDGISQVVLSPDGARLAFADAKGVVRIVEIPSGKEVSSPLPGTRPAVAWLVFSPDGKILVAGRFDYATQGSDLRFIDAATGKPVRTLQESRNAGSPPLPEFFPDGERFGVIGRDASTHLYRTATAKELLVLKDEAGLAFSPDGGYLAACSDPSLALRVRDASQGKELFRVPYAPWRGTLWGPGGYAFSPDGKSLAVSQRDGRLQLFAVPSGELLREMRTLGNRGSVMLLCAAPAFSPDGKVLAVRSDHALELWDPATGKLLSPLFEAHLDAVSSVSFSPDGKTLATGSCDGTVRLWDGGSGKPLGVLQGSGGVSSVSFSPDGRRVAAACAGPGTGRPQLGTGQGGGVRVWDTASGKETFGFDGGDPEGGARAAAFSPDGKTVASGWEGGQVCLHDPAAGSTRAFGDGARGRVRALGFSRGGRGIVSFSDPVDLGMAQFMAGAGMAAVGNMGRNAVSASVRLESAASGRELFRIENANDPFILGAASPDGEILAVIDLRAKGIRLWEMVSGKPVLEIPATPGCLAVSPDGRLIAGAVRGEIVLWDALSGEPAGRFAAADPVNALAFSPDGGRLVSGMEDGTALVWDLAAIRTFVPQRRPDPAGLEALWEDLAGDAPRAWKAAAALRDAGDGAAGFLRERLAKKVPGAEALDRWVKGLDDDDLEKREGAARELEALGPLAEPALRKRLEGPLSPAAADRIRDLLDNPRPGRLSAEGLRAARAVRVLE